MSKKAILFPGQGAQYFGLGKDFFDNYEEYKNVIELVQTYVDDFLDVIYYEDNAKLNETLYTQFAIASMEIGIYEIIKDKINIDAVAGFSLGEYAALYVSGVISKDEIFEVIKLRTDAMKNANTNGAMIAVLRLDIEEVKVHLANLKKEKNIDAYIANYNSSEQVVLSANNDVLDDVVKYLKDQGIRKVVPLNVSGPFHSIYYKEAAKIFKDSLENINILQPNIVLYLNTTGNKYNNENILDVCEKQMYTQVNWYPLIKNMIEDGVDTFIEVGPGQVLSGLMKKINKDVKIINVGKINDLEKLEEL